MKIRTLLILLLAPAFLMLGACDSRDSDAASLGREEMTSSDWTLGAPGAEPVADPVSFTLTGTITYQDRIYGTSAESPTGYGFTGSRLNPVRNAVVEVVDGADKVLATTGTDGSGGYTVSATGGGDLRLRIFARSRSPQVTIRDLDSRLIAVVQPFTPRQGAVSLDVEIPFTLAGRDFVGGAFNLLDVFTAGAEFVQARSGSLPGPLTVFWEPGNGTGTMFCRPTSNGCPNGSGIYVLGGGPATNNNDHDEYDDDVLWHEYGHFLEYEFGNLDSLGGGHRLGDSSQDLRLAWSEGWSDYLFGAVKGWLREQGSGVLSDDPALGNWFYIDTADDQAMVSVDFESGSIFGQPQYYASNESAVAKVLWNLHRNLGPDEVWNRFAGGLPERVFPANLESYWNAWMRATGRDPAPVLPHFRERRVNYSPDPAEGGESRAAPLVLQLSTAAADNTVARNLYLAPGVTDDTDYFSFTPPAASEYRVDTFHLINGTDTRVTVTQDASGSVWANDNFTGASYLATAERATLNIHGDCSTTGWTRSLLASSVTFSAAAGQNYLIEVSSPPQVPLAAGYYGGYSIRVTGADQTPAFDCP